MSIQTPADLTISTALIIVTAVLVSLMVFCLMLRFSWLGPCLLVIFATDFLKIGSLADGIRIGIFKVSDLVFFGTLFQALLIFLRNKRVERSRVQFQYPTGRSISVVTISFIAFLFFSVLASGLGLAKGIDIPVILYELRPLIFLASAFCVLAGIRSEKTLQILLIVGLFVATCIAIESIVLFALSFSNPSITFSLSGATIRPSWAYAHYYFTGRYLIFVVLVLVTSRLMTNNDGGSQVWLLLLWTILMVSILTTLERYLWLSYVAACFTMVIFLGLHRKIRLRSSLIWGIVLSIMIFISSNIPILQTLNIMAINRVSEMINSDDVLQTQTLSIRIYEANVALNQWRDSPLWGTGLGSAIFPYTIYTDRDQTRPQTYLHDAYVWLLTKTGLFNLLVYLIFMISVLMKAFSFKQDEMEDRRILNIGFGAALIGFMICNLTSPIAFNPASSLTTGLCIGIVLVLDSPSKIGEPGIHGMSIPRMRRKRG